MRMPHIMHVSWTVTCLLSASICANDAGDSRNIRGGHVIPDEGYCDQPYVVVTKDGHWLCTLTTGKGIEGNNGQHVVATISGDKGKTWSELIDIEPADGPEASWVMPLVTPTGRAYVFYDYNGDRVNELGQRKGIRADMLGWYVYKYSDDHGRTWSDKRYRLPVRHTEYDRINDWLGKVQMFWGIGKPIVAGRSVYFGFSKIAKYLVERSEGWFFRCDNLLTEPDPDKHEWVMLPDGDVGLRSPEGPIAEEQNPVALSDGSLYTMYRTVAGYPCHAYSTDGGHTWTPPAFATYTPGGRKMKTCRACPRLWKASNGNYLFWYHNHRGKDFKGRNPVWLAGGIERDGRIHWSQPEIVLYDPDPQVRISYPDLIEQDGKYWITETQKSVARVHEIEPTLIEGLWKQHTHDEVATEGLRLSLPGAGAGKLDLPRLPDLSKGGGFSLDMRVKLEDLSADQVLFEARDGDGKGIAAITSKSGTVQIVLSDGKTTASWDTDPGVVTPGKPYHVVAIVDGGPKIITFVVDGILCDGGEHREYGWGRFSEALGDVTGVKQIQATLAKGVESLRMYDRPLRTSEAVGNYRARLRLAMVPHTERWDVQFHACPPARVLEKLNLNHPGLEQVKTAADKGDRDGALKALLEYYRAKYPLPPASVNTVKEETIDEADRLVNHVLKWGPYQPAEYGKDVNWEADPAGDIEWVAAVYRFYWTSPLADAYQSTRDDKYARAFVELTTDWIAKHPIENWTKTHPIYTYWKGFAWLDLQTGIRAGRICAAFKTLVHSPAFTPEFLATLLVSLYDHQVKTETIPMGIVHNKAVFEQRGFVNVAHTFPEFADSRRWLELGLQRARENLLLQVTPDGVQREWCGGYHRAVLKDAVEVMTQAQSAGVDVPQDYKDCVRKMYEYVFAIATPDLGFPMFGDTARGKRQGDDRSQWHLHATLLGASALLDDPKYAALAKLERDHLPQGLSYAVRDAGMYVMRSDWGPDQIYFALHCSPPAISSHDTPDNGTFELYAFGRWLMTDSGFYTYGHDPQGRAWHRQTRVHQTLTLDGKDAKIDGSPRMWLTSPRCDTLVVENRSYADLLHRRTVWFVDKQFFVLLDEAIGNAPGTLDLHFQLAPGEAKLDPPGKCATTGFDDANVLVWASPAAPVSLEEEEGWSGCEYGHREPRKALRYRHRSPAPAAFLTLLVPHRGTSMPDVSAALPAGYTPGVSEVDLTARALGQTWRVGRNLIQQNAWCDPQ